MKHLLMATSCLALLALLGASILCAAGYLPSPANRAIMLACTFLWFALAPSWMLPGRSKP